MECVEVVRGEPSLMNQLEENNGQNQANPGEGLHWEDELEVAAAKGIACFRELHDDSTQWGSCQWAFKGSHRG